MKISNSKLYFLISIILILTSCQKDELEKKEKYSLENCFIQKGPFIQGSSINIQELNSEYNQTGNNFSTETEDDFGSFSLDVELVSQYVEIISNGYYFNEVTGEIDGPIELRNFTDISEGNKTNINILTTLSKDRIKNLISEGLTYQESKIKSEKEILKCFNIPDDIIDEVSDFELMDISKVGIGNSILLYVSVVLQQGNSSGELKELISKISSDVSTDGEINDINLLTKLRQNMREMNVNEVKSGLVERYSFLGIENITIPNFEDFLDKDEDGVMYNEDICPDTPLGEEVDENGCSDSQKDIDEDGVIDTKDMCPDTPLGEEVDENGCSDSQKDIDGDGVMDDIDKCLDTPEGEEIDENGCSVGQKTYVPDDIFEQRLIDLGYDDISDDYVITENIKVVTTLEIYDLKITDLTGIEGFTSLQILLCYGNHLTSLDVTNNTSLLTLNCGYNRLTSLDLSKNTSLELFECWYNYQLTSLDLSKNTSLITLYCDNCQLTSLDLSSNTLLSTLSCQSNQLTSLDLSRNTLLSTLSCQSNQLTSLDLSNNTLLSNLSCYNNQLTSLDLSNNTSLETVTLFGNQLLCIKVNQTQLNYYTSSWTKDFSSTWSTVCN